MKYYKEKIRTVPYVRIGLPFDKYIYDKFEPIFPCTSGNIARAIEHNENVVIRSF